MDYEEWIGREKRIRIKLLRDSPVIREKRLYRVCQNCDEICLCHEQACPNCNSNNIVQEKLNDAELLGGERIRCRFRFEHLT